MYAPVRDFMLVTTDMSFMCMVIRIIIIRLLRKRFKRKNFRLFPLCSMQPTSSHGETEAFNKPVERKQLLNACYITNHINNINTGHQDRVAINKVIDDSYLVTLFT